MSLCQDKSSVAVIRSARVFYPVKRGPYDPSGGEPPGPESKATGDLTVLLDPIPLPVPAKNRMCTRVDPGSPQEIGFQFKFRADESKSHTAGLNEGEPDFG